MKIWKMNGAGNAFAVFDARKTPFAPTTRDIQQIAADMKADQVMSMESHAGSDIFLKIWNSSGEEVSACGNGTRAVAHLLLNETSAPTVYIQTLADRLSGSRAENGAVTVDMGKPRFDWEDIPLSEKMDGRGIDLKVGPMDNPHLSRPAVVSMGNPHAVFFVDDVDAYNIPALGPLVEWHPMFPEGTNVGFAQVIDRETIRLRVWERGAGLTLACGTGACAALVCAARAGKTGRHARMILDGGDLQIEWREDNDHVMMTGPVEVEYERSL